MTAVPPVPTGQDGPWQARPNREAAPPVPANLPCLSADAAPSASGLPPQLRHDKADLRCHFRQRRKAALVAAATGLQQVARTQLPSLLPQGLWLGLYWPVGSEPDLDPWACGGLAERLAGAAGHCGPSSIAGSAAAGSDLSGPPGAAAVPARFSVAVSPPDRSPGAGAVIAAASVRLALPAVLPPRPGESRGRLVYLPWDPSAPLRPDACGIPAPLPPEGVEPEPLPPEALGLLLVPALAVDRSGLRLGSGGGWYDRLRADRAWGAVPALAVLPSACLVERLPGDPWDVPFSGWLDERGVWSARQAG